MKRFQYWERQGVLEHFADDFERTVTTVTGSEITRKQEFERTLNLEVTAQGSALGFLAKLSVEAKTSLRITNSITEVWRDSTTAVDKVTFKAGCSYLTWLLKEAFTVVKTAHVAHMRGTGPFDERNIYSRFDVPPVTATAEATIGIYRDKKRQSEVEYRRLQKLEEKSHDS